jgi:putative transposase
VVAAVKTEGMSRRAAAKRFGVSYSAAIEWVKLYEESGIVSPRKVGGSKPKKLSGAWRDWLIERCRKQAFTLRGLVAELAERGLEVDYRSVGVRRGGPFVQKRHWSRPSRIASGRRARRGAMAGLSEPYRSCPPVFIDET